MNPSFKTEEQTRPPGTLPLKHFRNKLEHQEPFHFFKLTAIFIWEIQDSWIGTLGHLRGNRTPHNTVKLKTSLLYLPPALVCNVNK